MSLLAGLAVLIGLAWVAHALDRIADALRGEEE